MEPVLKRDVTPAAPGGGDDKLLWNTRETALALDVCERTIWGLADAGELRAIRIGRCVRFSPDDVRDFIRRKRGI